MLDAAQPIYRIEALRALEATHAADGLMERAGAAAAALAEKICKSRGRPVLIIAGPGNNGGDALVVARRLIERDFAVCLVFAGQPERLPVEARDAFDRLLAAGGRSENDIPPNGQWDLVIDGLFGVGLARPVTGRHAKLIAGMQQSAETSGCALLSLDCPSGLDADTGRVLDCAVSATHTLSFLGLKPGLLTGDGPDLCGELLVDTLGVEPLPAMDALPVADIAPVGASIGRDSFAAVLKPRRRNSHKGSYGSAGILGGASSMVGASLLAGRAALKTGAGRVYLGLIDRIALRVDPMQPELMMRSPDALFDAPLTALAIGPGLGTDETALDLLGAAIERAMPLVIDADALTLLAADTTLGDTVAMRRAANVLTPHPAEAARLLGIGADAVQADRIAAAHLLARRFHAWVVLKGCGSVVVSPEGGWWINRSGNPGLASAGTGDVLTGLIVGLLAQGHDPGAALNAAVHLHGAAADQLALENGVVGITASELPDAARTLFNRWIAEKTG